MCILIVQKKRSASHSSAAPYRNKPMPSMEILDLLELTNFFLPPPLVRQQGFYHVLYTVENMLDTATGHKQQHPAPAPKGWPEGWPAPLGFSEGDDIFAMKRRRPSMPYIPADVPANEAVEEADPNPDYYAEE